MNSLNFLYLCSNVKAKGKFFSINYTAFAPFPKEKVWKLLLSISRINHWVGYIFVLKNFKCKLAMRSDKVLRNMVVSFFLAKSSSLIGF